MENLAGYSLEVNIGGVSMLRGADGKSAYQYAVEGGYTGTEAEFAEKLAAGSGLTTAQDNALDGMFKVAAYDDSKDVSGAYAAFKAAFGLVDSGGGGEETPDVPTYTITAELVNVTSSNSATSVAEGSSYTATLTAAEGYELDTVSVLMGGVDVTADVYADGVISIPAVTGNVEIVASAAETGTGGTTPAELITDGISFEYDFRSGSLELHNLTGWGNVYRIIDKTGTAFLFYDVTKTGEERGMTVDWRGNRVAAEETKDVNLGTTYTAMALYRPETLGSTTVQPSMFGWGINVVNSSTIRINPKYIANSAATSTTDHDISVSQAGYIAVTYVVDGTNLKVYVNETLEFTDDGSNYDGFTKWMDYGIPGGVYKQGYVVAFVGYNRALSEVEIIENLEYLKTLEVSE